MKYEGNILTLDDLEGEIWKDIKEWEGIYQISNLGRIKSLKKNIIRALWISTSGYLSVVLSTVDREKNCKVHKLLGQHFKDNPDNLQCVNHEDGNKLNNSLNNLKWSSKRDDILHAYRNGLNKGRGGVPQPLKWVKVRQLDIDGRFIREWDSATLAAKELKINRTHIPAVLRNKRNTAGKFKWEYVDPNHIKTYNKGIKDEALAAKRRAVREEVKLLQSK